MKNITIVLFFLLSTNIIYSQWSQDSTITNAGTNPSISAVSPTVAWVVGYTTIPVIYRTTNSGSTWVSIPTTGIPNVALYCVQAIDANTAYVGDGTGDAHVYKTTNAGQNWVSLFNTGGIKGFFNGVVFSRTNPNLGFAQSDPPAGPSNTYYIQLTTNNGTSWNLLIPPPPGYTGYMSSQHSPFLIDNNFFGFGFDNGGIVEITSNGGANWFTSYLGRSGFVSGLSFNTDKLHGIAAVSQSGLSKTTNGGINWTPISVSGIDGVFLSFCYWIPGTNVVYASASGSGIKRSIDGGTTWTSMTAGQTDIRHMDFVVSSNVIYGYAITGDGSTLKLKDSLVNLPVEMSYFKYTANDNNINLQWQTTVEINNSGFNIERSIIDGIWEKIGFVTGNGNKSTPTNYQFNDNNLQKAVYHYRLKQIDYNGNSEYFNLNSTVSIAAPQNYGLFQNYPNPSNPNTKIDFRLPFSGKVSLKVYDVRGQEVAILVNGTLEAGYYTFTFNGDNISSGIYFYKLVAGNFIDVKKMIFIK